MEIEYIPKLPFNEDIFPDIQIEQQDIVMSEEPIFDLSSMVQIIQYAADSTSLHINVVGFSLERKTTIVAIPKKFIDYILEFWDAHNLLRRLFNENYVAENVENVFIRYGDPLVINTWLDWLAILPLLTYFADCNKVEWAQGPVFLNVNSPLQDWAELYFVANKDKAFLVLLMDHGKLITEGLQSHIFEDELDTWAILMYLTTPKKRHELLAHIPCNLYFSRDFWESTLRRWALRQYVLPQVPIFLIESESESEVI